MKTQFRLTVAALFFSGSAAVAAPRIMTIDPHSTDPLIAPSEGRHVHIVSWDDAAKPNGLLLITLGGTGSTPDAFNDFRDAALPLGYRVLQIDYPNKIISTVCRASGAEPFCFDNFRREITTGKDVSPHVKVDAHNAIDNRIETLVRALTAGDDAASWKSFIDAHGSLDWSKVVLAGHSQGAGHAAYLAAKIHRVRGAIMLAGPQDSSDSGATAAWLSEDGKTPVGAYFFLLHAQDYFGSGLQIAAARALLHDPKAPVADIEDQIVPPKDPAARPPQIFLSRQPVPDAHMSVVTPVFLDVWKRLLSRAKNLGSTLGP